MATVKRLYDDRKLIVAKGLASKILDTSSGFAFENMGEVGGTFKKMWGEGDDDMPLGMNHEILWKEETCRDKYWLTSFLFRSCSVTATFFCHVNFC